MLLADLKYLSDRHTRQIQSWNEVQNEEEVDKCVHDVIFEQMLVHPTREAVCAWNGTLTYQELWRHVQHLAQVLVGLGAGPEVLVPLCFEKSVWSTVSLLAVLEAGAGFCLLDPAQPNARLQSLCSRLGAKFLLCSQKHWQKISKIVDTVLPIDAETFENLPASPLERKSRAAPSNVAYVVWTSGSTGEPKGVVNDHRAYCSAAKAHAPAMRMESGARVLQYASYVFDASILETLTPLMIGATTCVPSDESRLNGLPAAINQMRVDWAVLTPSVANFLTPALIPGLNTLSLVGEAMSQENIATWSTISLINAYGPAECSIAALANPNVHLSKEPTLIGRAIGAKCWLVDPGNHDRLMPPGCIAELCIEGPTLARGYLNDPERTRDSFIENPAWAISDDSNNPNRRMYKTGDLVRYQTVNGMLYFVGRKDTQVKLHGQRIELGEIEHHLAEKDSVRQSIITMPKSGFCKQRLVAVISLHAITPTNSVKNPSQLELLDRPNQEKAQPIIAVVRESLSSALPAFMIPSIWLAVPSLPLLQSGKLDRKAVLEWVQNLSEESYSQMVQSDETGNKPANEVESNLRSIWADVLNLRPSQVGLKLSFLRLGGDSISAMMVQSHCQKRNIGITVQDILRAKSISHLATLTQKVGNVARQEERIEEDFDLSPIQKLYFEIPRGKSHFNQSFYMRLTRPIQVTQLRQAAKVIVNRHSMLRARFRLSDFDDEWKQRITTDVSGSYAFRAHQIESKESAIPLISKSQASLDPVNGPLFAIDLFTRGVEDQLLFMTAHHLVVDLVSWRVILQDLEELLTNPNTASDAESSLSFQTWCKLQMEHAHTLPLNEVLPVGDIPIQNNTYWGMEGRANIYGDVSHEGFELDAQATSMITSECHHTLRTDTVDILTAAMLQSFSQVFPDRGPPTMFNEGHGREVLDKAHDLSRTIGWFTVMYPIHIPSSASNDFVDVLRRVKDFRRAVPANGRPYFASRLLTSKGAKKFGRHWPLEITFNYLGIYQQLERQDALLVPVEEMAGEARGAGGKADVGHDTPRFGMFEISAVIVQGRLRFSFTYNRHMKHQDNIKKWISECRETLHSIPPKLAKMTYQPTLSDYPLLSLTYANLEQLITDRLHRIGISDVTAIEDMYRCSQIQQGLLISRQRDVATYAIEEIYEAKSNDGIAVNSDRIASAWQKVVQRHASLRTLFVESLSRDEALYDQIVLKNAKANIVRLTAGNDAEAIQSLNFQSPMEYNDRTPPHRLSICDSATGGVFCKLEISHTIVDGASMSIIFKELVSLYEGRSLSETGPLYSNYIAFLQSQPAQAGIGFWKSYLTDVEPTIFPVLNDSTDLGRELHSRNLNVRDLTEIQSFCNLHGVTLANVFHTAWALTLQAYTGSKDVCYGYLMTVRDPAVEDVEDLVGYLVNMLFCRMTLEPETPLIAAMQQSQEDLSNAQTHRQTALSEVLHVLDLEGAPLFNTSLSYRKLPMAAAAEQHAISFNQCSPYYDPTEYSVGINIEVSDESAAITLDYWTDSLSDGHANNVANTFLHALDNIVNHEGSNFGQLNTLSGADQEQILIWNRPIPSAIDKCVHDVVSEQVALRPEAQAIQGWDATFTYAELDLLAGRLAKYLTLHGVGAGSNVCLCFEKSAFTIIGMLGVLKAGGAFASLDPMHPQSALELRIKDSQAQVILTSPCYVAVLAGMGLHVVSIDQGFLEKLQSLEDNFVVSAQPHDPCYVIYTSGSTGKPKGVVIEHRALVTSAQAHGSPLGIGSGTRVLQFASYTFDNNLEEIFTTLMRGGVVCVPSDHDRLNDLAGAVSRLEANFMDLTPTVATYLNPDEMPTIKGMVLGGEALTKSVLKVWGGRVPIYNMYGPSECTINSTLRMNIDKSSDPSNIGRAIGSVSWIVDPFDHNRLVPIGAEGELLLEGPILARGYLNDEEKTTQAFIENPAWTVGQQIQGLRRMYKTGDIVRYNSDGTIAYIGRKDQQIKLHGQRIELGEIEYHVRNHLATDWRFAIELVVPGNGPESTKALALFVCPQMSDSVSATVPENGLLPVSTMLQTTFKDLEASLAKAVPKHMVPSFYIPLARLPLTSSGKLDRKRLRDVASSLTENQMVMFRLAGSIGREPSTEIEKTLADLWETVLHLEPGSIGMDAQFFRMGGDSIAAIRLVTAARLKGISLTVANIFRNATLSEMCGNASVFDTLKTIAVQPAPQPFELLPAALPSDRIVHEVSSLCDIDRPDIEDVYPCNSIQEGLIALSRKQPGAYVAHNVYDISGIDVHRFQEAWRAVVAAEPILRTRIVYTDSLGFLQIVAKQAFDWTEASSLDRLLEGERSKTLDNGGKLCAYSLVKNGKGEPLFVWTIHHALYDGWSSELILNKVQACYQTSEVQDVSSGPPYSSFIRYLSTLDAAESDSYWQTRLADIASPQFPILPHPTYQPSATSLLSHCIPISRKGGTGITMPSLLRAAWALTISAYSNSEDVVFAETVTGRDAPVPGVVDMIGPAFATVPVRVQIRRDVSVGDYLKQLQSDFMESMPHQHAGLQRIKRISPDTAKACNFQNLVAINSDAPDADTSFWKPEKGGTVGNDFFTYALTTSFDVGQSDIKMSAHFDPEVISEWQLKRVTRYLERAMTVLLSSEAAASKLGDLHMIPAEDEISIKQWNSDPFTSINRPIHELIYEKAQGLPRLTPAITSWDAQLTYRELDQMADALAYQLQQAGVIHQSYVPLCFEKSALTVIAMLAVLKLGASFVALDGESPKARLENIIHDIDANNILCSSKYKQICESLGIKTLVIDKSIISGLKKPTPVSLDPKNDIAYIIFTSGSTGKPKGTLISHSAFVSGAYAHGPAMRIDSSSRVLQFASYTFDASIVEIFTSLILGGCVCIPDDQTRLNDITKAINDMKVNWTLLTPSFAQMIAPSNVPTLRTLVLGGEAMSTNHLSKWADKVHLINAYGPSECAVVATVNSHVSSNSQASNIGRAVGGHGFIVNQNNHDELVPVGATGELVIQGPILARGYLKEPLKTEEAFIRNPKWMSTLDSSCFSEDRMIYKTGDLVRYADDGSFLISGRKDSQTKLHGQRLELGEIEHHLGQVPGIQHGLAVLPSRGPFEKKLVGVVSFKDKMELQLSHEDLHVVTRNYAQPHIREIREHLSKCLPPYMVASNWVIVQDLPLMPSGKLNRRRVITWLEEMPEEVFRELTGSEQQNLNVQGSDVEEQLRAIWSKVLNLPPEKVGLENNFLYLGGDSISALQVASQCRAQDLGVTVQDIIRCTSISHLASRVTLPQKTIYADEEYDHAFDLSPIQQLFFEWVGEDVNHFNQSVALKLNHRKTAGEVSMAVESLVNSHSMLRARFEKSGANSWLQKLDRRASKSYRFTHHPGSFSTEQIISVIERTQSSLDIQAGPIFAANLFESHENSAQVLSLVVHHLNIDVVSWGIILEDLNDLLVTGKTLHQPSLSFQIWSRLQKDQVHSQLPTVVYSEKDSPVADYAYWGMSDKSNVYGAVRDLDFSIDESTTRKLLGPCNHTYQTEIVDILLGSLLYAFCRAFPDRKSPPAVFNEGHGREPWDSSLDLTRTVGWFTTICPVFLPSEACQDADIAKIVRWIKDQRSRSKDKGRQYFAHRMLSNHGSDSFDSHWPMEIAFNYLGQERHFRKTGSLLQSLDWLSTDSDIGASVPRFALFDVSASVSKERLKVSMAYSQQLERQSAVQAWAAEFEKALNRCSERLLQVEPQPTLSAFPLLPLRYNAIEQLQKKLSSQGVSSVSDLQDVYGCSPMQRGLLLSQIKNTGQYMYQSVFSATSSNSASPVDAKRLAHAWQMVVQKHSALRTVFIESVTNQGLMDQIVLKSISPRTISLQCGPANAMETLDKQKPLNFTDTQPHHQMTICETSSGHVFCKLELNHAICDGTSIPILLNDLAHFYKSNAKQTTEKLLYRDYISYIQQSSRVEDVTYWRKYLQEVEPCHFPSLLDSTDFPRELRTLELRLDNVSQVHAFCSQHSVTLSNVLQLIWSLVLRAYTGSNSVCFGYLNSGRDIPLEGIQDAVGLFISMLVCRMDISNEMSVNKALEQIKDDYAQSTAHQGFSLGEMQHEVNVSGKALFNTAFTFQRRPEADSAEDQGLIFDVYEATDPSEYDLTVNVEARKGDIEVNFNYWANFLCDKQAKNISDSFEQALRSMLQTVDPQRKIGNLDICSKEQMKQILHWNQAPLPNVNRLVHEIIYEQSQCLPLSKQAICSWDTELTYLKLMSLSKRLSKHLAALGVQPDSKIPICFEKSSWAVVAMLGVLQAGGAFVPLDPSHPENRIHFILNNVDAKLILCSTKHREKFTGVEAINTLVLDDDFYLQEQAGLECEPTKPTPANAAYLIFTSGTTGLPKGTIISHQAFATGATEHAPAIKMNKDSRVLQFSNLCFDASIMEILTTLMTGGCVCIPSEEERLNDISGAIERMKVNWTLLTPSVANVLEPESVPSLDVLVTGGEAMQARHIDKWRGKTSLVNAYGPSECAVIATTSTKVDEHGSLINDNPAVIGDAVGCRSWVVSPNDHNRIMPIGSVGELAVEGNTLARGYLNEQEKTAKSFVSRPKFVTRPSWRELAEREHANGPAKLMYKTGDLVRYNPDGKITYVSRKDTQIKLNGLRIELGEIEHHVKRNLPENIQTAVDLVATAGQPRTLAVFFCSDQRSLRGEPPNKDSADEGSDSLLLPMTEAAIVLFKTLKANLAGALPTYMMPSLFLPIAHMPWTLSGKLDRPRLCRTVAWLPKAETAPYRLISSNNKRIPATTMEQKLESLWRTILNLEPGEVTLDDSFFVLGGDSVQAMRLVAAAREQRLLLTVLDIFHKTRLFEMAEACSVMEDEDQGVLEPFTLLSGVEAFDQLLDEIVAECQVERAQVADAYPCSALQEGLITLSIKQAGAYVAQNVFLLDQTVNLPRFKGAWEKAVEEMDILKTRIVHTSTSGFLQVVLHHANIEWHTAESIEEVTDSPLQLPEKSGSPLMRFTIVDGDDRYLVWSIHHSIYDGWSMPKMLQRVEEIYMEDAQPPVKASYSGFIKYLQDVDSQASDQFWKSKFEGSRGLEFPNVSSIDVSEQATTTTLGYTFELSTKPVGTAITLPTMIRAAWAIILSAHTGCEDVVFGETLAGRDIPVNGILDMLGPTITTVPTRVQANSALPVMEYLQHIKEMAADIIPYQHVGLQHIRKLSAETAKACDFRNLLVIQTADNSDGSNIWEPQDRGGSSNFFTYPLVFECNMVESAIQVDAHYNDRIISKFYVQRLVLQLDSVLSQLCSASIKGATKLSDVQVVTEQDSKLLHEWAHRVSFIDSSYDSLARTKGSTWIVNPGNHDRLMPLGCAGELLLEGPALAREYLHDAEKTSKALINDPAWVQQAFSNAKTHGQFYKTGDLAKYNEDGDIFLVRREQNQTKLQAQGNAYEQVEHKTENTNEVESQNTTANDDEHNDDLGSAPPVTETPQKLREIWASVFGVPVDQIDQNESFMSQGGDSLIAMSLVARCRRIGITLSLQEILQSQSLMQIASMVDARHTSANADKPKVLEEKVDQLFELSPIQQLYFQVAGPSSDHTREMRFNQSQLLRIKRKTEGKTLQNAIEAIVQQHSMFRARFVRSKDGSWKQRITRTASESYRFQEHHQINSKDKMLPILSESQTSLNLEKGPLLAVELINTEKDGQILSLLAHHLIVDVVSWNIILQQLGDMLAFRTDTIHKPLSFQVWCTMQKDHASRREASRIREVLPYHVEAANIDFWGMRDRTNTYAETRCEKFSLDVSSTRLVLGKSNKALRTQPVEVFMAAVAHSFSNVFPNRKAPSIFNESHGRDAWDPSIDLTATTGWFTSLYPIHVAAEEENMSIVDVLKRMKDLRRSTPENGRAYFAHRYFTPDGQKRFGDHTAMEILFNYTGQSNQLENDDSLFQPFDSKTNQDEERFIGDVGPHTRRLALFEISVVVSNDQAHYSFIYNSQMQHVDKILQWVAKCRETVENLAKQLAALRPEPTLHDYPLLPTDYIGLQAHMNETLPEIGLSSMEDVEDIYVCAPTQEGILFAQINDPGQYLSYVILDVRLPQAGARINPKLLAKAWQKVVDRHQSLRTVFIPSVCDSHAFDQIVVKSVDGGARLFHCEDSQYEKELDKISLLGVNSTRRPQLPFQLSICTTTSGKCYAKLEMNHAVLDGGSGNIVTRDLGLAYQGLLPEGPRPLFSDYIKHIESQDHAAGIKFWTHYLGGIKRCYLPKMSTVPEEQQGLNSIYLQFDRFDDLQTFCRRNEVTLSNVLLAGWGLVLKQYTSSDDVCFGNITAGKDVPVEGIQDAVGAFINMLVCRIDFRQSKTLKDAIRKVQSDFLGSLEHQHCSLAKIHHDLGLSKEPLFNSAISIQNQISTMDADKEGDVIEFETLNGHAPTEV